ncbi:formylglycine-generating enzyme family protein [Anabaena sp. UHCC 0451]|uniref:formylglycine-generating enzyme family protein n=1 Tax=Anabaena sp. UHCC 0451 TaxID=2055235 RepID=UPI002B21A852|nr:formylglycine-generating enzyme family protein [Anabaena sp. UHCC 0451]MEA5574933.1 formylglycine-generating enzyme family protein [Anabaena sp. UHCC 0451]
MNNSPNYTTIKNLITRLDKLKLPDDLALDDEDIADMIWLALKMGDVEQQTSNNTEGSIEFRPIERLPDDNNINEIDDSKPEVFNAYVNDKKPENTEQITEPVKKSETTPQTSGFPFPVAAAPAIDNSLEIARSLRPLKRKVAAKNRFILDEEATVNRIIERNIWTPVTKPAPERWLYLELVVEDSKSSFIWQGLIDELEQILEKQGAFRNIRCWIIPTENNPTTNKNKQNKLALYRRYKGGKLAQRKHQYKELIHPDKRGLILIVSDCVSPLWENHIFYQCLKDWSTSQPTAILQFFPENLWDSTQLSSGRKIFAKSSKPGVVNQKLELENLPFWVSVNWRENLVLPVLNLEPAILNLWSKVVAGFGNGRISTYLFDLTYLQENLSPNLSPTKKEALNSEGLGEVANDLSPNLSPTRREALNSPPSLVGKGDGGLGEDEKAQKIVKNFLATASPIAQRLAGMMAALPVDMAVVNLLRKTCLKAAKTVHVAEFYMAGLLEDVTPKNHEGKERVYDFIPGVRKVLNNAMAINETENVLDAVSAYIGERIGLSVNSFTALIANFPKNQDTQDKLLPFAHIAVDVFKNIGGEYAEFADAINKYIPPKITTPPPPPPPPPEPELKTCEFEVATIEIIKQTTFKFVVATLERKSKQTNWIVNRQEKQAVGVIEELAEGVNLELMEIPGGKFRMGSPEDEERRYDDESPQHEVTVPRFYMGKYPITQKQWRVVAGWEQIDKELNPDPSRFKEDYKGIERWQRPVENIRWSDAKEFCNRLSKKTGYEYRLPTEAEWEYACRAGTSTPFHFGSTITAELANYRGTDVYGEGVKGEYRKQTTPVGYFKVANNFGLYDMHGNVWEWCEDDWHDNYEGAPTDGSAWISKQANNNKVRRGGSWNNVTRNCRCATRYNFGNNNLNGGFRVVRVPPRTDRI